MKYHNSILGAIGNTPLIKIPRKSKKLNSCGEHICKLEYMHATNAVHLVSGEALWDALVQQALGGTIISTSAWLNCAALATAGADHRIGCFRNGNLIAGGSGLARKRSGRNRLETPELTPHTGLLLAPVQSKGPAKAEAEQHRACELLIDYLEKKYDHP